MKIKDKEIKKIIDEQMTKILNGLNTIQSLITKKYGLGSNQNDMFNDISNNIIYSELNPMFEKIFEVENPFFNPIKNENLLNDIIEDCKLQIRKLDENIEAYKNDTEQVYGFKKRKEYYQFMIDRLIVRFY